MPFSHSDQKQLSWSPINIDLGDVLDVILDQLRPLAEAKRLALTTDIQADLLIFRDVDHLTRLFLNLIDNAIKYTPRDGQIAVKAVNNSQNIVIQFKNSGPGIPKDHLPNLFDRFYRGASDRSSQTGGTGLGLAIANEIVRLHKGKIRITSEPEQGVMETIHLPGPPQR